MYYRKQELQDSTREPIWRNPFFAPNYEAFQPIDDTSRITLHYVSNNNLLGRHFESSMF